MNHVFTRVLGVAALALAGLSCGPHAPDVPLRRVQVSPEPGDDADVPEEESLADYVRARGRRASPDAPWEWRIETSVRVLRHPASGVRLLLFSMCHVGREAYYRSLEPLLRGADLVVIEGVNQSDARQAPSSPDVDFILDSQGADRWLLGLQAQSAWEHRVVDTRWINVDFSLERATEFFKAEPGGPGTKEDQEFFERVRKARSGAAPAEELARLRNMSFAGLLEGILDASEGDRSRYSRLQRARNAAVFRWVRRRLSEGRERSVALVYGAIHLQAMGPRFVRELGFRLESATWHEVLSRTLEPWDVDSWTLRGYLREEGEDHAGAVEDLTRAIDLNPKHSTAYWHRCRARAGLLDLAGAASDADRVLALDPDNDRALGMSGNLRLRMGRYDQALASFSRLVERSPKLAGGWYGRGVCRAYQGDLEGGIEDLTRAIDLNPAFTGAYSDRGQLLQRRGNAKAAVGDFSKAIELEPRQPEYRFRRGDARYDDGDYVGAVADAEAALALDPRCWEAFLVRGKSRLRKGEFPRAIADYEKATELQPDVAKNWLQLGQARQVSGDSAGARVAYSKAIEQDPGYMLARYSRATAYFDEQQWDSAIAEYRKLIQDFPGYAGLPVARIWVAQSLRGEGDAAARDLLDFLKSDTNAGWEWRLLLFLAGEIPEEKLLSLAASMKDDAAGHVCEALFFAGARRLLRGDRKGARELLEKQRGHRFCDYLEHLSAEVLLRRLEKD